MGAEQTWAKPQPQAMPAAPPAAGAVPAAAPQPATLLLVDDEASVLSALRRLFRPHGYAIEQATSGAEGLALLRTRPVDLVISDMRMPGMDGASFLEQVRQRHPSTVRILLTGYADVGSTIAAINRGEIHRYICKPWDDKDLHLVVAEALARRALERENAQLLALTREQNQALQDMNRTLEDRVAERTTELQLSAEQLRAANAELETGFTLAVTVFTGLLEMRQDGIAGHARRVGELSRRMAARLGLDEPAQRQVHLAGLLHDIGEIGYPDEMLARPESRYSAAETVRLHRHPLDGEAALMALDALQEVALIVRQHHERVDGRGFPDQLVGSDIRLGARIVGVASDYDGLLSGRTAEHAYSPERARDALLAHVGTHYDARVVQALFAVLADMEAEAQAETEVDVAALQPKMQLARDLLSPQGAVLLPAGYRFDAAMIRKLQDFASRNAMAMGLPILCRSLPPAAAGRPAGAA